MRFESYLPLPIVQAFDQRSRLGLSVDSAFRRWSASLALPTAWPTMPSADFCLVVRASCDALSPGTVVSGSAYPLTPPFGIGVPQLALPTNRLGHQADLPR